MPDIHDGRELFSEPPPQGDLSVSPGSHTKPVRLLPQVAPQSCLTICPRVDAQAYPDTVFKREGRGDSASSAGLKLTTEPRQRASAFSPHATTDWTRLAQSVWQENRRFLEEVPLPRDTPAWLRSSPAFSPAPWSDKPLHESELEEVLPLHYGIRLDEHRVDSCRSIATVVAFQVTAPPPPPLLTFPFATLPPFSRTPTLPTPFEDGVLPFRAPVKQTLAIFSLTGGSGRTSIAAGLARLLAGSGLRVLLVDTSAFSLLPRLFGAVESRQGIIRNFVPASGEQNRMISLISLAVEPFAGDDYEQYRILQELQRHAARVDRVVWDLSGAPLDWAAKVLGAAPQILVPLLPNTNSLMQLRATQRFLNQCHDEDPSPHLRYVLNHFDEQDGLHRDMQHRFQKALGSRLLRIPLRRSLLIDEALSRGQTIVDYAPDSSPVSDLRQLALQLHQLEERDGPPSCTPSEWYEH